MNGKVVRVVAEKGYGFIKSDFDQVEYFFHRTGFDGHWDDLVTDLNDKKKVTVSFDSTTGTKGPRAESVRRTDGGVNGL